MSSDEMTLRVLYEIRDGVRATNERVDATNARLDVMNSKLTTFEDRLERVEERLERVEARSERLGAQIVESEIRTATAINETSFTLQQIYKAIKDRNREIDDIKRRLDE